MGRKFQSVGALTLKDQFIASAEQALYGRYKTDRK